MAVSKALRSKVKVITGPQVLAMAKLTSFSQLESLTLSMNSQMILLGRSLNLQRWPLAQKNRTLQAWDSADEYLITHSHEQNLIDDQCKLLIINDSFGALGCWFADLKPFICSDSYVSQQGIIENHRSNQLSLQPAHMLASTDLIPGDITLVLIKVPKNNAFLHYLLAKLNHSLPAGTVIIGAGKTTDIHNSTLALFEQYIGPTTTSLAKKKSRLIFATLGVAKAKLVPAPTQWPLQNTSLTIVNHANVFSRDSLDIGARLLLAHLPTIEQTARIIDLGCGNAVLGLSLLQQNPGCQLCFVDESHMAVQSAKDSVTLNMPQLVDQCRFEVDDCLTRQADNSVDVVLCNPPFHQQQAVTDHIAWQMFKDALRVLKPGGQLRIVGNRNLAYQVKLKRLFGHCQLIASNHKFVVLAANKAGSQLITQEKQ